MKVKILKCLLKSYWYANRVGEVFDVQTTYGTSGDYVVLENNPTDINPTRYIIGEDCAELVEPKNPLESLYKAQFQADTKRWDGVNGHTYYNPDTGETFVGQEKAFAKAPPIGLRPANIAARERMFEILTAMNNYTDQFKKVPQIWVDEYLVLNNFMKE